MAARVSDPVDVVDGEHGASADAGATAGFLDHCTDAGERLGRVQRHLDQTDPGLDQRLEHGLRLGRRDPAQDCDQGTVAAEDGIAHDVLAGRNRMARASWTSPMRTISPPSSASAD